MKTELREIPKKEYYTIYIADDGKEFESRYACQQYEGYTLKKYPEVVRTSKKFYTFSEGTSATIYNIKTIEDWQYLESHDWDNSNVYGEFEGPGYYIAEYWDGGDGRDSYYIYEAEKYIKNIEKEFEQYKKDFYKNISNT